MAVREGLQNFKKFHIIFQEFRYILYITPLKFLKMVFNSFKIYVYFMYHSLRFFYLFFLFPFVSLGVIVSAWRDYLVL